MTKTVEGVRDPIYTQPEYDNAVLRFTLFHKGQDDIICTVDDDGLVRHPDTEEPMSIASYSIVDVDVDAETWGDHYHHPADCPENKHRKTATPRSQCEGCTPAVSRAHDREHYRSRDDSTSNNIDMGEVSKAVEHIRANSARQDTTMYVDNATQKALNSDV